MPDLLSRLPGHRNGARPSDSDQRFQRGTRSVVDAISPGVIEASRSHLMVDGQYLRILALAEYPRYVHPNWLGRLIDFDAPLDVSLHLEPLDSAAAIRQLTHKLVELQSSRMLDARSGKIASAEREVAYEDVDRLRDSLQRGEERVFSSSLYLCLRAPESGGAGRTDSPRRSGPERNACLLAACPLRNATRPSFLPPGWPGPPRPLPQPRHEAAPRR